MRTVLCPGSFDPVTMGHLDIIERAAAIFDHCIVAIFRNAGKSPLFTSEERVAMVREAVSRLANVTVEESDGLLAEFAESRGVVALVKGLRVVSDFEYEVQMANMNRRLAPGVETIFLVSRPEHAFLSSSIVKDVARFGGDVAGLVPDHVREALARKFG